MEERYYKNEAEKALNWVYRHPGFMSENFTVHSTGELKCTVHKNYVKMYWDTIDEDGNSHHTSVIVDLAPVQKRVTVKHFFRYINRKDLLEMLCFMDSIMQIAEKCVIGGTRIKRFDETVYGCDKIIVIDNENYRLLKIIKY